MHWYGREHHGSTAPIDLSRDENAQRLLAYTWDDMEPFFEELRSWMTVLGYPTRDVFALSLAVHEAATNAFRHGNRGNPNKCVWVRYLVTGTEALVEVEDQGCGFDLNQVPDPLDEENVHRPGGRGLFLMRAYATWVSFNPLGNRVTLCRRRTDL